VASTKNKLREARLRWFGHIRKRNVDASVRRCERLDCPEYRRGKGRRIRVGMKLLDTT